MTSLTFNSLPAQARESSFEEATEGPLPLRLRLSMVTFGMLSRLGPESPLFLPLSCIAIFSGVMNYSWHREITLRGEEINRNVFLHSGGDPQRSTRQIAGVN
jgi:hypothetical protein